MFKKQIRWSQDKRRKMYREIVRAIGPHLCWDETIRPLAKRKEYDQLLQRLAREFGGERSALQAQINWATTSQMPVMDRSRVRNFILNKAAALEMGFISSSELPSHMTISN